MNTLHDIRTRLWLFGLTLAIMLTFSSDAYAQKPVNGNGRIVEQIRPLDTFSGVLLDFSANVTIVNGQTPSFRIEADENVLPHIGTKVRFGKLHITQDKWIEPSQKVVIHIGAPFTSKIETSGYSNVVVENIDGPRLQVDAGVGNVMLHGKADRLRIRTKTGNVNASDLETGYADVAISSHGTVKLGSVEELIVDAANTGTVIYAEQPGEIQSKNEKTRIISAADYEEPEATEIKYVEFRLVNNSRSRIALRVEGPQQRSFGYGFSLGASGARKENWPVGTKVYKEGRLLTDELLVTITEDMAGKRVKLFDEN